MAGLHPSTVSLALRNTGTISAATRERVQSLARELGYRPDPLVASFASRRFRSRSAVAGTRIALVTGLDPADPAPVRRRYLEAASETARLLGYDPEVYPLSRHPDARALSRVLHHRRVAGVVFTSVLTLPAGWELRWDGFAVVLCQPNPPLEGRFLSVRYDAFAAMALVLRETRRRGYRRIGVVLLRHEPEIEDDAARWGAWSAWRRDETGRDSIPPLVLPAPGRRDSSYVGEAVGRWLREHSPDAVAAFNPWIGYLIRQQGWKVPEQVALAAMHVTDEYGGAWAGTMENPAEVARHAVEQLDQQIRHGRRGEDGAPSLLLRQRWTDGASMPATAETRGEGAGRRRG